MSPLSSLLALPSLSPLHLRSLLNASSPEDLEALFQAAYDVKLKHVGNRVYFRGIVEFSNICTKDCYYCGIRKSNGAVQRFCMTADEVLDSARWAHDNAYGSIVLQSGERMDKENALFVENILKEVQKIGDGKLRVTLSLGEQSVEVYQRWFDAGARRYLLRIETTNPDLYTRMHPADHSFDNRVGCLRTLKRIGYQTGTGVMIGLPGQTVDDLVNDVLFFKENDIDMIGMGPYVVHHDTPLGAQAPNTKEDQTERFLLGLKMIAVCRLYLKDVNIAATTALQALDPLGREKGLKAGANIIMPIITNLKYRKDYLLYEGKPCVDDTPSHCKQCIVGRIRSVGDEVGFSEWGDSPHFQKRQNEG